MLFVNLSELGPEEKGILKYIDGDEIYTARLSNLGFNRETVITGMPYRRKGLAAFRVLNTVIALRNDDAGNIYVIKEGEL